MAGTTTTRKRAPRARKPKGTVNMVDTAADIIKDDDDTPGKPPRAQKAGPKKVLSETQKQIADVGASAIHDVTKRKNGKSLFSFQEAQGITHPITRMIGRRLPDWLKKFAPSVKVATNPEDAADIEELLVTLGKVALRLAIDIVQEAMDNRENARAAAQQRQAASAPAPAQTWAPAPAPAPRNLPMVIDSTPPAEEDAIPVGVLTSNGHNPMFNVLGTDLGIQP